MLEGYAIERINVKLMAKNALTTGAFLKATRELLTESAAAASYLDQWGRSNCDPDDTALLNIAAILQQHTKRLPMPTLSQLGDPERATAALTALDDGSLREQVANINEAHALLEWIDTYRKLSANT